MHGRRKKDVVELSPEEKEKQRQQVSTARALFAKLLGQRQAKVYSQQALDMTSKALQFHPEFPTLWGYRREILESGQADGDLWRLLKTEMKLLEGALRKSQKVYSIWFHRRWVIERLFGLCGAATDKAQSLLDTELGLCRNLLDVDERNFHCWNHRAHVLGLMRRLLEVRAVAPATGTETPAAGAQAPAAGAEAGGGGDEAAAGISGPIPISAPNPDAAAGGGDAAAGARAAAGPDAAGGPQPGGPASAGLAVQAGPEAGAGTEVAAAVAEAGADGGAGTGPATAAEASVPVAGEASASAGPDASAGAQAAAARGGAAQAPAASPAPATSVGGLVELDLKLSTELINRNFSNYSAWHLRTLLQQAPPGEGAEERLTSSSPVDVEKELEWVQQGIYTEPNDQSVWLYHHWLTILSRGCEQPRITHCALLGGELFVFFSRPVCARGADGPSAAPPASARAAGAAAAVPGVLAPLGGPNSAHRRTRQLAEGRRRWALAWRFVPAEGAEASGLSAASSLEVEASVEVQGTTADGAPASITERLAFSGQPVVCDASTELPAGASPALAALALPEPGARRGDLLRGELARVDELLELEPDCRWALLARGRLAIAGAAGSPPSVVEATERAVAEGYERISSLDPLRSGFYTEARAAGLVRVRVMGWLAAGGALSAPLDLSGLCLRHLAPAPTVAAFGVRILSVEDNELQELGPLLLLSSLEDLRAARNRLVGDVAEAFALPRLRRLDLRGNAVAIRGAAVDPPRQLAEVDVSDNPPVLAAGKAAAEQEGGAAQALLGRLLAGASAEVRGRWDLAWDPAAGLCRCSLRSAA